MKLSKRNIVFKIQAFSILASSQTMRMVSFFDQKSYKRKIQFIPPPHSKEQANIHVKFPIDSLRVDTCEPQKVNPSVVLYKDSLVLDQSN